jgi:hypothetical protein
MQHPNGHYDGVVLPNLHIRHPRHSSDGRIVPTIFKTALVWDGTCTSESPHLRRHMFKTHQPNRVLTVLEVGVVRNPSNAFNPILQTLKPLNPNNLKLPPWQTRPKGKSLPGFKRICKSLRRLKQNFSFVFKVFHVFSGFQVLGSWVYGFEFKFI